MKDKKSEDKKSEQTQVLVTEKTYEVDKKDFLNIHNVKDTWWNTVAQFMDTLRLIPRFLMVCYGIIFWITTQWFMALPDPTNAQAAFISTIVGAGAAWFGLYVRK
jgi:hypothetical protein